MKEHLEERTIEVAKYIVENKCTVRVAALQFGISKSTVHKDVTERLKYVDKRLYGKVKAVLKENKDERHIRGGLATRRKYSEKRR